MLEWQFTLTGGNEHLCVAEALRVIANILNDGGKK